MTLPSWDEEVVLHHHATGAALPAKVGRTDGETLALVLQAVPEDPLAEGSGEVEFTSTGGVHRVPAAIVGHLIDEPPVVLVRVDGPEHLVLQRRDAFRVVAYLSVRVRACESSDPGALTTTVDVSARGLLIKDPLGLVPGEEVEIELELTEATPGPPVRARGRLVRVAESDLKGVMIEAISSTDQQRLFRFVTRRERELLARNRYLR